MLTAAHPSRAHRGPRAAVRASLIAAFAFVSGSGISIAEPITAAAAAMTVEDAERAVSVTPSLSTNAISWFGVADPWAGIPFLSQPEAPAGTMKLVGDQHGRVISGLSFRNRGVGRPAIYLYKVRNLTIDLVDLDTVSEGIVIYNSVDVRIRRVRARNIYGPYTRTTAHTGNLIQIVNSRRIRVSDLKLDQPDTPPAGYTAYGTEDIISIGGCSGCWGGDSWSRPMLIERFAIDGGAWRSRSGSGIFVGDGGAGKNVWFRDGVLLNPGQVGIGTGRGGPYRFERIDIIGQQRPLSNDSVQLRTAYTAWGRVRTDWRKADGTKVYMNRDGYRFTDLGGNWWRAALDVNLLRAVVAP